MSIQEYNFVPYTSQGPRHRTSEPYLKVYEKGIYLSTGARQLIKEWKYISIFIDKPNHAVMIRKGSGTPLDYPFKSSAGVVGAKIGKIVKPGMYLFTEVYLGDSLVFKFYDGLDK